MLFPLKHKKEAIHLHKSLRFALSTVETSEAAFQYMLAD